MRRKIRNKIEHYEFKFDARQSKVIIGRILGFIFEFSKTQLDLKLIKEYIEKKQTKLVNIHNDFIEEMRAVLIGNLDIEYLNDCSLCGIQSLDTSNGECLLCGNVEDKMKCDICGKYVWESSLESVEVTEECDGGKEVSYGLGICHDCTGPTDFGFDY